MVIIQLKEVFDSFFFHTSPPSGVHSLIHLLYLLYPLIRSVSGALDVRWEYTHEGWPEYGIHKLILASFWEIG